MADEWMTSGKSYGMPGRQGRIPTNSAMYESATVAPNGDVVMAPQGGTLGSPLPHYTGERAIGIFTPQTRTFRLVPVAGCAVSPPCTTAHMHTRARASARER